MAVPARSNVTSLSRSVLLLIVLFGLDKVLAFGRLFIVSQTFSLPLQDSFNAANNLPDLLFALISGGAFAMAFIPLLRETITLRGRDSAWDLFSRVANVMFVATGMAAAVVAVFAEPIVSAEVGIAPGFGPEQRHLIADLMRLNLISLMIFSVSGLVMGGLQANQHFLFPALAPIFYNVGQLIGALFFAPLEPVTLGPLTLPSLGLGVHGLVYGAIFGAALHLGIQIPGLVYYQFCWTPSLDIRNSGLLAALRLMTPRLFTIFGVQAMFLMRDNLASRLGQEGAVSVLTYGWMIMQVPETLLGTAVATALLPSLSEFAANKDWIAFRETLEKAIRILIVLTLLVGAVIMAGLKPLAALAFGGLGDDGVDLLTLTSRVYLFTLTGYALQETFSRAFYARKEPLMPLFGVLLRLVVYLTIGVIAVWVTPQVGAPVIALAEIALTAEALFMMWFMNRRLAHPVSVGGALLRGAAAALLGGAIAYGLAIILPLPGYQSALLGGLLGFGAAMPLAWPEVRQIFRL